MSEYILSQAVNVELERTSGSCGGQPVAAVSGYMAEGDAGGVSASTPTPNSGGGASPPNGKRFTRLVGFRKIRDLLQPVHSFFANKKAWIESFTQYSDADKDLVYPNIKADKGNPYRKHQLTSKSSTRTYKRIKNLVNSRNIDDFQVCDLTLTMPKFMSEYLAQQGKQGRELAWRLFNGFWTEDLPEVIKQPELELACHVNLHVWRTQQPLEPHFHFHTLIPNYAHVKDDSEDEETTSLIVIPVPNETALILKKWNWYRQRGGKRIEVPFNNGQLELLKKLWADRLKRFCKRHSLEWSQVYDKDTDSYRDQKIDVYVYAINDWVRFLHKLNYVSRSWLEDFANYSNANPECAAPPGWLVDYGNKSRVKGWWSNIKEFTVEDTDKGKISPYTGEKMTCIDRCVWPNELLNAGNSFGYVDFSKGRAFESDFTNEEIEWLKSKVTYSDTWSNEVDH